MIGVIIYQDLSIGRGYFVRYEEDVFCENYYHTLWGAKRKARKMLRNLKEGKGKSRKDILKMEIKNE